MKLWMQLVFSFIFLSLLLNSHPWLSFECQTASEQLQIFFTYTNSRIILSEQKETSLAAASLDNEPHKNYLWSKRKVVDFQWCYTDFEIMQVEVKTQMLFNDGWERWGEGQGMIKYNESWLLEIICILEVIITENEKFKLKVIKKKATF